jgi:L-aminopeptidase/D-esterase-like protein
VHAILLCGGSAFGLDAAGGVMEWLREREIGYAVGAYRVPLVCAAVLFDLTLSGGRYPDRALGYRAAERASAQRVAEGNAGAGAGASVGKVRGMEFAMKGGLGSASLGLRDGVVVGAIVAVNALGSVLDPQDGRVIAGPRDATGRPQHAARLILEEGLDGEAVASNTTIGVVATNARLTKAQATTLASCAHDALARTIAPAHTQRDGDTVFALSTGQAEAPVDLLCVAAVEALSRAIVRGVTEAAPAGGLPAAR